MGTYTFRWESPAEKVLVAGTWDDWTHEVELKKENGVFQRQLDLPSLDTTYQYKFIVDGKWDFDHKLITENDKNGNTNNVLPPDHIQPFPAGGRSHHGVHEAPITAAAAISTVGAGATTAALAGQVPLEKDKPKENEAVPSAHGENTASAAISTVGAGATTAALAGQVPLEKDKSKESEAVPSAHDEGSANKETSEPTFSVNPLPATAGYGNPVQLKPGETVPPSSAVTSNTVESTVRGGNDVTDFSGANVAGGAVAGGLVAAGAASHDKDSKESPFSVPDASKGVIPESSLPMGSGTKPTEAYTGPTISSAAAGSTTADLAGQVPLEPSSKTRAEDGESGEKAKSDESEKKEGGVLAAVTAGGAAAAAFATDFPARVQEALSGINNGKNPLASDSEKDESTETPKEAEPEPAAKETGPASAVPEEVKESIKQAHESPEAAANPEAVREKSAVEEELERKVGRTDAGGEPGPTTSASMSATAPVATTERVRSPKIVDEDTMPAIAVASGAGLVGAAGASEAVAKTSHEKEGETNASSNVEEFKKDPIGFPSSASPAKTDDPRSASSTFSNDPLGPSDTAHLKPSKEEEVKTAAEVTAAGTAAGAGVGAAAGAVTAAHDDHKDSHTQSSDVVDKAAPETKNTSELKSPTTAEVTAAGTAAGATAATGATAAHEAFKNDDVGKSSDARPESSADPRTHSSAFENDPLSAKDTAHLKPAENSTAADAKDDTLHQKAVASGLDAAASSPAQQVNATQPTTSSPKSPAAAAAAAAMGVGAGGAAATAAHRKNDSAVTTSSLNKPFHGRKVSISPDDISRDVSPMTRENLAPSSGRVSKDASPEVTTGVSTGPTSAVSGSANDQQDASTPNIEEGASPSSTKGKKSKRRSFMMKIKQAFTTHAV